MFRFLALVFAAASCMGACQPNNSGLAIELPRLPVYPKDGRIPPALKDRFVFLNEQDNNEAIVTLPSNDTNAARTIAEKITLKIGICPSLTVGITKTDGSFNYEYRLANLKGAKQTLGTWVLPLPFKTSAEVIASPGGWRGSEANPDESIQAGNLRAITGSGDQGRAQLLRATMIKRKIDWFSQNDPGVARNAVLGLYKVRSKALPGIVVSYFEGDSLIGADSSWPPNVLDQLLALNWTENDSVSLLTIGPKFDPNLSRSAIAKDYLGVIDGAIKQKRIRTSAFLVEAISRLTVMSSGGRVTPWASKPVTPLEKQIFLRIELSLN